ncbi:MAG: SGNH/GDSL hydrolase family protein [Polyangiaceae bacterium]
MPLPRSNANFTLAALTASLFLLACDGNDSGSKGNESGTAGATSSTSNTGGVTSSTTTASGGLDGSTTSRGGQSAGGGAGGTTSSGGATGGASSGGSTASTLGCAGMDPETGFDEIAFSDPNIRYVGRVYKSTDSAAFAFPAVQIETVFEGDAIDMRLKDHGSTSATATNYYWVIVDGQATKMAVCANREVYPLARGLGAGQHTVTIVKRTESGPGGQANRGEGEFLGFRVRTGTALKPAAKPERLLEFVGDSITCGYGDEVSTTTPDNYKFTSAHEDSWNAYGALTARTLKADYVAVAASGRGVIRNYGGFSGLVVPQIYEKTLHEDSAAPDWDHEGYSPDVVVVNLGTNDYSTGLTTDQLDAHHAAFRQGYVDFLTRIREVHATATIVAVVGPMLSDSYPTGYQAWTSVKREVQAAVEARHTANDPNVYYFALAPQSSPYGEDWHPTLATHQKMADALTPFIANLKGW